MNIHLLLIILACAGKKGASETTTDDSNVDTVTEDTVTEDTFSFISQEIPLSLRQTMAGVSWHEGCPLSLDELRLIRVSHWGFDGELHEGMIIVADSTTDVFEAVFSVAFESGFPFERIEPVSSYGGSDSDSMAANNTSAFNCRSVTGGSGWSQHSYGNAIDINPIQNPYVSGSTVLPPEGQEFLDRDTAAKGLIMGGDPIVTAFINAGWGWGGNWTSLKDYQHFSENGN
jgi:poly-gamma-glutamate synthesis protein (capsule biosynthesis protein)